MKIWENIRSDLFDHAEEINKIGPLVTGYSKINGVDIAVVGCLDKKNIGANEAVKMAEFVLKVIENNKNIPIIMLVDNNGHKLALWDELVGNNRCIAHLGKALFLAQKMGHKVLGLVCGRAVSGGFMATGMATERCFALADAELMVMAPVAMSRITKIPLKKLEELCTLSPVLGPGVDNFRRIGGIEEILTGNIKEQLSSVLESDFSGVDGRLELGVEREGRLMAGEVYEKVKNGLSV